MKNIADPNTKINAKRSITLKVVFEPKDERDQIDIEVDVKSSIVPMRKVKSAARMEEDGTGRFVLVEHYRGQYSGQVKLSEPDYLEEEDIPEAVEEVLKKQTTNVRTIKSSERKSK